MTQTVDRPAGTDPLSRVESFLSAHGSDVDGLVANEGGHLHVSDLEALLVAARAAVELEAELANLRATMSPKVRTGQLLAEARHDRDLMRDTLLDVEELAARHHRGDPYGVQGAAAQQILDAIASGPTSGVRAQIGAAALETAAAELLDHADGDDDPQALAAGWLEQRATDVRAGTIRA